MALDVVLRQTLWSTEATLYMSDIITMQPVEKSLVFFAAKFPFTKVSTEM